MPIQTSLTFKALPRRSRCSQDEENLDPEKPIISRERAIAPIASQVDAPPLTLPSTQRSSSPESSISLSHEMEHMRHLPDSTDWIPTSLPLFEALEASLRCEVCKEFYNNPVISKCTHTFCSLCIRRCINADGKCPTCKSPCVADKLIPNVALRDAVIKFQDARAQAMELAKKEQQKAEIPVPAKKRKVEDTDLEEEEESERRTRSRQTRSSTRRSGRTNYSPVVIADSEDEEEIQEEKLAAGIVRCPICNAAMQEELVFNHIPSCEQGATLDTKPKKSPFPPAAQNRRRNPSPPPAYLSGLNYTLLNETALRNKMKELGISSLGNKQKLILRHKEWLNRYNSNCDSSESTRKSRRQLLKDLEEWERSLSKDISVKDSLYMRKDWDGSAHAAEQKDEFAKLIEKARAASKKSKPGQEESGDDNEQQGQTSTSVPMSSGQISINEETPNSPRPYENNEVALATIRAKVEEANHTGSTPIVKDSPSEAPPASSSLANQDVPGYQPFGSPSRKIPMFKVPEEPVSDIEGSTTIS